MQRSWGRMAGAVTAQKKLRHCKRVLVGPQWQVLASAVASAATNKATTESSANLGFCHSSPASLIYSTKLLHLNIARKITMYFRNYLNSS